jgi:sugar phosphate isomerase/epimerase
MRLSCLPVSFFGAISSGQMPLEEWLDFAAELGLDGVECGPLLVKPLGPAEPAEFRRLAEARGLAVSNFTGYTDFTQPDPAGREREVAAARESLRIALEVGAPSFRALTGQRRAGVDVERGVRWVVEGLRAVAGDARRLGIQVNVENHTKAFTWTDFDFAMQAEVFLDVIAGLGDSPVGVQYDCANPFVSGDDALDLLERVKSRVRYVHLNDVARPGVFEFVPVGSGLAPVRETLAVLRDAGYDGWVSVEEASRTGKDGFRSAVAFARRCLVELGVPRGAD